MDPILLGLVGFGAMFLLIALQVPIGVSMAVAGVIGVGALIGFGPAATLFATEVSSAISNENLAVIAIFLLMGSFANVAGLSADVFRLAYGLIGHRPGGLSTATILGCAGFGAVCGSSIATTATMARVALPEMRARGYSPQLASGSIASGGTLGILIPPSVIMVLYAVLTEQFIVALFAAALLPGVIAVVLYVAAVELFVRLRPEAGPPGPRLDWRERIAYLIASWRVIVLAVAVSGGIYTGLFTVSEAASVGASIALVMALVSGRMTRSLFVESLMEAAGNTCLIFVILIGASIFSYFISLSGGPGAVVDVIRNSALPPLAVIFLLMLVYIVLGSVFDTVAAMVITLPFVFPLVLDLGYDPVWWGVMMVMVMEVGMITPPIGLNVFVIRGAADNISLKQIYAGIVPFLIADLTRLTLLAVFPSLALALPRLLGIV